MVPTFQWVPDVTFIEYSELPSTTLAPALAGNHYQLTVQLYDAETLEKLTVRLIAGDATTPDEQTLVLPFSLATPP